MAKLIFLGTSNAISDENHENTHMVLVGARQSILIDCPNNPIVRFEKAGVDVSTLSDLILTHFHPDHVGGVPQLLMNLWLMGRTKPLIVHGLAHTIERIEKMMGLYNSSEWPGFFPVEYKRVEEQRMAPMLANEDFNILGSPVKHFIPTLGLRIEFVRPKKSLAYSCDTEPCPQVVQLAEKADILVHEASGHQPGHSSAAQAGEAASNASVAALYLIHYPTGRYLHGSPIKEAREHFSGEIKLVEDYMVVDFG